MKISTNFLIEEISAFVVNDKNIFKGDSHHLQTTFFFKVIITSLL